MDFCENSYVCFNQGYLELRDDSFAFKVDNSRPIFDSVKVLLSLSLGVLELKYRVLGELHIHMV